MEKLALGICLVCLLYIVLFLILHFWSERFWGDAELREKWIKLKETSKSRLKQSLNLRMKEESGDFAN